MEKKEFLQTLKVQELRKMCKENNIIGVGKKKKSELIELMNDCEIKGLVLTEPEEEIILHLPLPTEGEADQVFVADIALVTNYDRALARGKEILKIIND